MWALLGFVLWTLISGAVGSYYQPSISKVGSSIYFNYAKDGKVIQKKIW